MVNGNLHRQKRRHQRSILTISSVTCTFTKECTSQGQNQGAWGWMAQHPHFILSLNIFSLLASWVWGYVGQRVLVQPPLPPSHPLTYPPTTKPAIHIFLHMTPVSVSCIIIYLYIFRLTRALITWKIHVKYPDIVVIRRCLKYEVQVAHSKNRSHKEHS